MKEFHSSQLLSQPCKPIEFVVGGLLPLGSAGCDLFGPPGEGKSTIALSLCASISTGAQWCGLRTRQMPVAWVTGEASSEDAVARDLARLGVTSDTDILFFQPDAELFRFCEERWFTTTEGEKVLARLREAQIGFVVLDTIGSLVAGSKEIDNDQQRQLARHVRASLCGFTWMTISHTNQSSTKDDLGWRLHYLSRAGGNGYPGAVRWAAGVSALRDEEVEEQGLAGGKRYVAVGASKHNEMGPPVWTNRSPSIFEMLPDGRLVLVRDGREGAIKKTAARMVGKGKEGRHEERRPAVCTL